MAALPAFATRSLRRSSRMATEMISLQRWKRPSPAFVLVILITVAGLLISVALPTLILPKFSGKPIAITFQVQVQDDQGIPIPNANVFVGDASAQTGLDGYCAIIREFPAKGVKGLTGSCRLDGELRVEAPGYTSWRGELSEIFSRRYNYFEHGTNLAHEVTLHR